MLMINTALSLLLLTNILVFDLKIVIVRSNQLFIQSNLWNANFKTDLTFITTDLTHFSHDQTYYHVRSMMNTNRIKWIAF